MDDTPLEGAELERALAESQARTRAQWAQEEARDAGIRRIEASKGVENLKARIEKQKQAAQRDMDQRNAERKSRPEMEREAQKFREQRWTEWMQERYPRFVDATKDTLTDKAIAGVFWEWLTDPKRQALIILGDIGRGKTWIAFAAMREYYLARRRVKFWPVPALLQAMRPGGEDGTFDEACSVDLLVLDDMGRERVTDWTHERMYVLINERWMQEKATVITSNRRLPDLKNVIGDGMFSRLLDGARIMQVGLSEQDRRHPT